MSILPKGNGVLAFGAPEGGPDSDLSIVPKKKPQQINVSNSRRNSEHGAPRDETRCASLELCCSRGSQEECQVSSSESPCTTQSLRFLQESGLASVLSGDVAVHPHPFNVDVIPQPLLHLHPVVSRLPLCAVF